MSMRTEGPYIIANDTWFKTHHAALWGRLLRNFFKADVRKDCVFGDIRTEASAFVEKPSPYLSSWIFYIPNKAVLMQFQACLERAIATAREANFSRRLLGLCSGLVTAEKSLVWMAYAVSGHFCTGTQA
jgi:hypothetical protein